MRYPLLFLALLLLPAAFALTPIDAGTMEARVLITNSVRFEELGTRYVVDEASGTLTWFPQDTWLQEAGDLTIEPHAEQSNEQIRFLWNNPRSTETISVAGNVKTKNAIIPIRQKVAFPFEEVPPELTMYLGESEIADQSPQIQQLAQRLAAGKTDAAEVVFALADWTTTNVNYSLASMRAPAIQHSSQVLQSRYGKCDELTSLFISLNRALGIPARFVSGYSYTNSDLFTEQWGGHGWAEVWFPGVGWVPYDVTYGEYGYLDAGHVQMKRSDDAKETSIDFSARGDDFDIQTEPLGIYVTPLKLTEHGDPGISISLDVPYRDVGFGSAVLIMATVKNERDYYVSTRLDVSRTSQTELISDTYKNILLKPRQSIQVPFLVKIDEHLDSGYRYEFPFHVYSRLGESANITINVQQHSPVYDASAYQELISHTNGVSAPEPFGVTCSRGEIAYAGENVTHTCTLSGASAAKELSVCNTTCELVTLDEGTFTITTQDARAGITTIPYTAKIGSQRASFFVTSRTVEPTALTITIDNPVNVTPDDIVIFTVNLSHRGSLPKDVDVTLRVQHAIATEHIETLDAPARLRFTAPGRQLRPDENEVTVIVDYTDELGNAQQETVTSTINLEDVGVLDHLLFWLEDAGRAVVDVFS